MKIGILGTGAYGLALSLMFYENKCSIKMWTKFFPAPLKDSVKKIMHASIGRELLSGTKAIADGEKLMKNKKLVERIAVLEKELIKSGSASKSIDDFWKANADRWGYKYSTNYSTLKQAPGPL